MYKLGKKFKHKLNIIQRPPEKDKFQQRETNYRSTVTKKWLWIINRRQETNGCVSEAERRSQKSTIQIKTKNTVINICIAKKD